MSTSNIPCHCYPQAVKCLEFAAKNFIGPVEGGHHATLLFACERDRHCQEVLSRTYGTCVFPDVMQYGAKKTHLNCMTHGKMCPCTVEADVEDTFQQLVFL